MRAMRPRRVQRAVILACVGAAGLLWVVTRQLPTHQGVNFRVATQQIPLYVKLLDFVHRDAHYRLLANQVAGGLQGDQARVLAVFQWTREHIRSIPDGWPVVDDHVWHIVIRGYGADDQMADVVTTLATYAGVPAFWKYLRLSSDGPMLVLSFAKVDGTWAVFDVAHGVIFADAQGRLVAVETLLADPALADAIAGDIHPWGFAYSRYLAVLHPFTVPGMLRARKQMPWPRLLHEVQQAIAPSP